MISLPDAPSQRGQTQITTRAMTVVVTAVVADALGVQPDQVSVDVDNAAGPLDLTVRVPRSAVRSTTNSATAGATEGDPVHAETAADGIRRRVGDLTGAPIARVTVRLRRARIRIPELHLAARSTPEEKEGTR